jgi:hypothetical protein
MGLKYAKILKLAISFLSLAEGDPLKDIEKAEHYNERKEIAEKAFKHISSGSSRITYLTKDNTVIKLAKNDKGLAQNEAEATADIKSKYLNSTIKHAKNYSWIEVPYAEKITEKQFEEMTDLTFEDFGEAIKYGLKKVSGNSGKEKPKNFKEVSESEIYKEVKRIGEKLKLLPGDLARISSFGSKDGHPIIIDAGLTVNIYDTYYEDEST